jgi:hypothetical protein
VLAGLRGGDALLGMAGVEAADVDGARAWRRRCGQMPKASLITPAWATVTTATSGVSRS